MIARQPYLPRFMAGAPAIRWAPARCNLLGFPFDSTRNIVSLLNSRTVSRGPEVGAVEQIRFGQDAEHRIDRRFAGRSRCVVVGAGGEL
jgi:hypothetical protein